MGVTWEQDEEWTALARELSLSGCAPLSLYPFRWSFDALRRSVEVTSRPPRTCADMLYGRRDGHEFFVMPPSANAAGHTLVVSSIDPPLGLEIEVRRKLFTDRAEEIVDEALPRFAKDATPTVWRGVEGFVVAGPPVDRAVALFEGREGLALRGRIERSVRFLRIGDDAVFSGSSGLVTRANDVRHDFAIATDLARRMAARRLALAPSDEESQVRDAWARVSAKLDLGFDGARCHAYGNVGSMHLDLRSACTREAWWTSVQVSLPRRRSTDVTIVQLPVGRYAPPHEEIVLTGHVGFDTHFVLRATDESRAAMRMHVFETLVEHAQMATNTVVRPGLLSFEVPGRIRTDEGIEVLVERALQLASTLFDVARVGPYR